MPRIELLDMIFADDIVTFRGDLYKVLKVNPAKYRAVNEAGVVWNLPRDAQVKKATPEQAASFTTALPEFEVGHAVRFLGRDAGRFPGVWVISKVDGGSAHFVRLGGGPGAQLRGGLNNVEQVDEINKHAV